MAEEKELTLHLVKTGSCGEIEVFVQGDLDLAKKEERCTFLTVHDIGSNHLDIVEFTKHVAMQGITNRSVFLHVSIPGQNLGEQDLNPDARFPTMQALGECLVTVLDKLEIKYALGLGVGAGSNIIARFAMKNQSRVLGTILIHPTSTSAGMVEHVRDQIINWKLESVGHNPTAEQYLVFHKFGYQVEKAKDKTKAMNEYKERLHNQLNPRNLKMYVEAFMNRTDISHKLASELSCDILIITGSKSSFLHSVETMYTHCNPAKCSILRIDDVGDVMFEATESSAQSILLFCQGLGYLTSLGIGGNRSRSGSINPPEKHLNISMAEYDKPNVKRLSLSARGDSEH